MILMCATSLASLSLVSCSWLSDSQGVSFRSFKDIELITTLLDFNSFRFTLHIKKDFQFNSIQFYLKGQCDLVWSHISICKYWPCQHRGAHRPTAGLASCSPRDCVRRAPVNAGRPSWCLLLDPELPAKRHHTVSGGMSHHETTERYRKIISDCIS